MIMSSISLCVLGKIRGGEKKGEKPCTSTYRPKRELYCRTSRYSWILENGLYGLPLNHSTNTHGASTRDSPVVRLWAAQREENSQEKVCDCSWKCSGPLYYKGERQRCCNRVRSLKPCWTVRYSQERRKRRPRGKGMPSQSQPSENSKKKGVHIW